MQASPRQVEILTLLAKGLSDKEIGRRLGISPRTVETHLGQLYDRSGLHSRAGLVALWLKEASHA
ncbi:MAG TPA: helix-turn-helix transcriptional regulator [Candidatus Dormibacteraeota bacterium]|nr:helix-turn-helix transcriptional regulator [Candidatus Dormibacteraeota bacterium]